MEHCNQMFGSMMLQKKFPLQKLHHYYGFFRTCNIRSYFHTRTFVSLYFSVGIISQDSPVPFMSLCHAPVASTPIAVHTVNSSRQPHNFPVFDCTC